MLEYIIGFLAIFLSVLYLLLFLEHRHDIPADPKPRRFPRVSVIIPAYNEEKTLQKTIESVLALDYPGKVDAIVVDDGSSDATYKIAKGFAKKGVRVFTKPNGGKASAINLGLKHAKGELVAVLDADSFVERSALKFMVGYFEKPDVMAVTPTMKVWQPRNILERFQRAEYLFEVFARKLLSFLDAVRVTPGPFSMYRAKVFKELGGFDEKSLTEDQEIAMRIQSANYKIACSLNAIVHTVAPSSVLGLLKQRLRWYTGYLLTTYQYRGLIRKSYGDLGFFIMPMTLVILMLAVFGIGYNFLLNIWDLMGHRVGIGDVIASRFTFMHLKLSTLHVLLFIILLLNFIVMYLSIRNIPGERGVVQRFVSYVVFSFFLMGIWIMTLASRVFGVNFGWREK